jgi:hypothetical protein
MHGCAKGYLYSKAAGKCVAHGEFVLSARGKSAVAHLASGGRVVRQSGSFRQCQHVPPCRAGYRPVKRAYGVCCYRSASAKKKVAKRRAKRRVYF